MVDVAADANDRNEQRPERRPVIRKGSGGLRFYKSGQGYYTRIGTAIGGTIFILWGGAAVYDLLSSTLSPDTAYYNPVSYGVTVAFVLGLGALLYWAVGLSRGPNDFFIATEGEMKKVSWSSKKDVIRSTKVVITTVILLGMMLFVVDLAFMWFFSLLGVLKAFPGIKAFLTSGGNP